MTNLRRSIAKANDRCTTVWNYRYIVVAVFILAMVLVLAVAGRIPPQYVATTNMLVVNGNTRDDPTLQSPDLPAIATSSIVLDRTRVALGLDLPIVTMKKHLVVKQPAYKSSILSVAYTDSYPLRSILIANGVADQMTKYFGEVSTARFDSDLNALDGEIAKQQKRIRQLDDSIRSHGALGVSALDEKGAETLAGRISTLEGDRALAAAALVGDRSHLQAFDSEAKGRAALARSEILQNDKVYNELQSALATNSAALASERGAYTPAFPGLVTLQSKVDSLTSSILSQKGRVLTSPDAVSPSAETFATDRRNAAALVVADRAKLSAIDGLLQTERDRLALLPSIEMLRLERNAAQADYLTISGRRATALANRADALSLGSVVVVDRAMAAEGVTGFSGKRLVFSLALLALVLAISSAFFAEALDPRLRQRRQIEGLYGNAVVGTLGHIS